MGKKPTHEDMLRPDKSEGFGHAQDWMCVLRFCGKPVGGKCHYLHGEHSSSVPKLYRCGGAECPACYRWKEIWRRDGPDAHREAQQYKPVERWWCNVLFPGSWGGYKVWQFGQSVHKQLNELILANPMPWDYFAWVFHPIDFDPTRLAFLDDIWKKIEGESKAAGLIYADWLEERGDEKSVLLSEAIRLYYVRRKGRKERMTLLRNRLGDYIPTDLLDTYNGMNIRVTRTMHGGGYDNHMRFPQYNLRLDDYARPGMTIACFKTVREWEPFDLTHLAEPGDNALLDRVINGNPDYRS